MCDGLAAMENGKRATRFVHIGEIEPAVIEESDPRRVLPSANASPGEEFVGQKIQDRRVVAQDQFQYLVEWGGWPNSNQYTWEPRSGLIVNSKVLVEKFDMLHEALVTQASTRAKKKRAVRDAAGRGKRRAK